MGESDNPLYFITGQTASNNLTQQQLDTMFRRDNSTQELSGRFSFLRVGKSSKLCTQVFNWSQNESLVQLVPSCQLVLFALAYEIAKKQSQCRNKLGRFTTQITGA